MVAAALLIAGGLWPAPAHAESLRVLTFNLRYASAPDGDNAWINTNQSPQRREVAVRVVLDRNPDVIGF